MTTEFKIINDVAGDTGNVTLKVSINGKPIEDQPSVIKRMNITPTIAEGGISTKVDLLFKDLAVHITSDAIERSGLFYVGYRALQQPQSEAMNIKLGEKHLSDVPVIGTLATIAANAVKEAYAKTNTLPKQIDTENSLATNIPAAKWNPSKSTHLEQRYLNKGKDHLVIVYVGEEQVLVRVKFTQVKVTQEGMPAHYKLISAQDDILRKMKESYAADPSDNEEEAKRKKAIRDMKPEDFTNLRSLGMDIGAGTTEKIYMEGKKPVAAKSFGIIGGIGHAATEAANALNETLKGALNVNRHQFDEILLDTKHVHHERAKQCMDDANYELAKMLFEQYQERYDAVGGNVDFIPVYGGGSITLEEYLYPKMLDFANRVSAILVWIPAEYAPYMNRDGLYELLTTVFFPKTTATHPKGALKEGKN